MKRHLYGLAGRVQHGDKRQINNDNTALNVTSRAQITFTAIITQYATPLANSSLLAAPASVSAGPRIVTLGTANLLTDPSVGSLNEAPTSLLSSAVVAYESLASAHMATITIDNRHSLQSQTLGIHAPSHSASTAAPSEGKTSSAFAGKDTGTNWPVAFNLILLLFMLLYMLINCRLLFRKLSPHNLSSGLFLRKTRSVVASDHMQHPCRGYVSPARATSRIQARLRGLYNRYLLYTVPLSGMTIAQLMVLALYCGSAIVADYVLQGAVAGNAVRSGRTAIAQLPIAFALASKNSPLSLLLGSSYDKVNFIHRFAGRIIFICSALHSVLYIWEFYTAGNLDLLRPVNLTGLIALGLLLIVLFTSLSFVRRKTYGVFLSCHIVGWIGMLVALFMHAPYIRDWVYACFIIIGLDLVLRVARTRVITAEVIAVQSSNDRRAGMTKLCTSDIQSGWSAGQHVIVRTAGWRCIDGHPFTIATSADYTSTSDARVGLTLYTKAAGDWTRRLYNSACVKPDSEKARLEKKSIKMLIQGPYGQGLISSMSVESLLLVAGGSGITFPLSVLEEVVASAVSSSATYHTIQRIKLLYITPRLHATRCRNGISDPIVKRLGELVYTASTRTPLAVQVVIWETRADEEQYVAGGLHLKGLDLPALIRKGSNASDVSVLPAYTRYSTAPLPVYDIGVQECSLNVRQGRPNLTSELQEFLRATLDARSRKNELCGGVGMSTCGPATLIEAARKAAREVQADLALAVGGVVVDSQKFGW